MDNQDRASDTRGHLGVATLPPQSLYTSGRQWGRSNRCTNIQLDLAVTTKRKSLYLPTSYHTSQHHYHTPSLALVFKIIEMTSNKFILSPNKSVREREQHLLQGEIQRHQEPHQKPLRNVASLIFGVTLNSAVRQPASAPNIATMVTDSHDVSHTARHRA